MNRKHLFTPGSQMNFCSGTSSNSGYIFFFQDNTGTSQDKSQCVTSSRWHLTASIFDKRKFLQREDRIQPVKLQAYPKKENHLQVIKPLPSQARLTYTADCNTHTHTHPSMYINNLLRSMYPNNSSCILKFHLNLEKTQGDQALGRSGLLFTLHNSIKGSGGSLHGRLPPSSTSVLESSTNSS